jgi:hypothetical protein
MKRFIQFLRRLRPMFKPLGLVVILLLPAILVIAGCSIPAQPLDRLLLWPGLVFQISGFVLIWYQIRIALRKYNRPVWLDRIRLFFSAVSGRSKTIHAEGGAFGISGASAWGRVGYNPADESPQAQIDALKKSFESLQGEFDVYRNETRKEMTALAAKIIDEKSAREKDVAEIGRQLEEQAVGSADIQLFGLMLFIVGTFYAAIPQDLVRLFT